MISDYYTESVAVYSPATSTSIWGSEPGWTTSPTTVSAAMNPVSGSVMLHNEKESAFADYKLYCRSTVDIDVHDKVVWSGSSFDVVYVKNTLDMGHHLSCLLKKRSL